MSSEIEQAFFPLAEYLPPAGCQDPLEALVHDAVSMLKSHVQWVQYPAELCRRGIDEQWRGQFREIDKKNEKLLDGLLSRGGVYALLTASPKDNWTLRYIGQADAKGIRQRVRSHLVWRNKQTASGRYTASKFDEISAAVMAGDHVGFSFVAVEPDSLRHHVESQLLRQFHPEWNFHGTTLKGQMLSKRHCQWHRDS